MSHQWEKEYYFSAFSLQREERVSRWERLWCVIKREDQLRWYPCYYVYGRNLFFMNVRKSILREKWSDLSVSFGLFPLQYNHLFFFSFTSSGVSNYQWSWRVRCHPKRGWKWFFQKENLLWTNQKWVLSSSFMCPLGVWVMVPLLYFKGQRKKGREQCIAHVPIKWESFYFQFHLYHYQLHESLKHEWSWCVKIVLSIDWWSYHFSFLSFSVFFFKIKGTSRKGATCHLLDGNIFSLYFSYYFFEFWKIGLVIKSKTKQNNINLN